MIQDIEKHSAIEWTDEPITGLVLLSAQYDSDGNPIRSDKKYYVGRHMQSGKIAIQIAKQ